MTRRGHCQNSAGTCADLVRAIETIRQLRQREWPPPRGTFHPHQLLDSLHAHLDGCGTDELWRIAASAARIAARARTVARQRDDQLPLDCGLS